MVIQDKKMARWAGDVEIFLMNHWNEMRSNPLAIYHLFALAPRLTVFQEFYAKLESFPHPVVTMGLKDDWPSRTTINPHTIDSWCLSACGSWFVTGGKDDNVPVYGVWNVELEDGKTYTHPCHKFTCFVHHVSFHQQESTLRLQTVCNCGLLCIWSPFSTPPTLIEGIRLESDRRHWIWSEDGSKSVTQGKSRTSEFLLWRRNIPQQSVWLCGGDQRSGQWTFSPGAGNKLACYQWELLDVWDGITVEHLFRKRISGFVGHVKFAPDATTILFMGYDPKSIHCLSAEDGSTIWQRDMPIKQVCRLNFFSHGQKIAIQNDDGVNVVSALDGITLVDQCKLSGIDIFELTSHFDSLFINPEDEQNAILFHGGAIWKWNPLENKTLWKLSEKARFDSSRGEFHVSWRHNVLIQCGNDMVSFSLVPSNPDQIQESHHVVSSLLLSPDRKYIALLSEKGNVQICDIDSGTELLSNALPKVAGINTFEINMAFDLPSLFIWSRGFLYIVDIKRCLVKDFDVENLAGAALFNSSPSPSILMVNMNGEVHLCSNDGSTRDVICHISANSLDYQKPVVSPDETMLAIRQGHILIIKQISGDGREIHWPSECIDVVFTPDSNFIIALESMPEENGRLITMSLLGLPDLDVYYRWSRSDLWDNTFYSSLAYTAFYDINTTWARYYQVICALESHHSRTIIPVTLHKEEHGWIGYCQNYLLKHIWHSRQNPNEQFHGNITAWIGYDGQAIITDMSLFFEHMYVPSLLLFWAHTFFSHKRTGSIEHVDLWIDDWLGWCEDMEGLRRKIQILDHPQMMGSLLEELGEFERTVEELRCWGQLEPVIDILIGEQQGCSTVERLKRARTDARIMRNIGHFWSDKGLMEIQSFKHLMNERLQKVLWEGIRTINIAMEDKEKGSIPYPLHMFAFLCIRQVREKNCHQRSNWERIYKEIERMNEVYSIPTSGVNSRFGVPVEWTRWMYDNATLAEEDIRTGQENDLNDDWYSKFPLFGS
jgi:hypothetical protein